MCQAPNPPSSPDSDSHPFVQKYSTDVLGLLQGLDRVRLQGTLRSLYHPSVMETYLYRAGVLWKDFKTFASGLTQRIRQAAADLAQKAQRPLLYLPSSQSSKDELARTIAQRDQVGSGLVAIFSCLEPCRTYAVCGNRSTQKLQLKLESGKCLHLYFYVIHPVLGWLHLRLQTWFPFLIQIGLNGREWLSRQLDATGLPYRRYHNCISWVADRARAQALLDEQLRADWPGLCQQLVEPYHPCHAEISRPLGLSYYWTVAESEYATDVLFHQRARLEQIYPALVHHAITSFGSQHVLRFLGKRVPEARLAEGSFAGEIQSNLRARLEGVRVKHWLNGNSLKCYDKASVLRVELTLNNPDDFKVYRPTGSEPEGRNEWRPLRRSVADLHRRAQISRAGTERYLTALAAVQERTPLGQEAAAVCEPVRVEGRRYRALNPWAAEEARLLTLINRGEWMLRGFRNRDLRAHLYPGRSSGTGQTRQRSAAVTRKLALLRAHGLITKVPRTHRYLVSPRGRRVITALLAAHQADITQLTQLALAV
jgi:hypothetical protein